MRQTDAFFTVATSFLPPPPIATVAKLNAICFIRENTFVVRKIDNGGSFPYIQLYFKGQQNKAKFREQRGVGRGVMTMSLTKITLGTL